MERAKNVRIALIIVAVVFFIMSAIMLMQGNNKMTKYNNSEKYPSNNVNAYVGGDAYNYIINGNYATGYFVLAIGFLLAGILCLVTNAIVYAINDSSNRLSEVQQINHSGKELEECI